MEKIKFESTNCEGTVVTFEFAAVAWPEVADNFYLFLVASGFVLEKDYLSEHFSNNN
jgi:hypothetical protein